MNQAARKILGGKGSTGVLPAISNLKKLCNHPKVGSGLGCGCGKGTPCAPLRPTHSHTHIYDAVHSTVAGGDHLCAPSRAPCTHNAALTCTHLARSRILPHAQLIYDAVHSTVVGEERATSKDSKASCVAGFEVSGGAVMRAFACEAGLSRAAWWALRKVSGGRTHVACALWLVARVGGEGVRARAHGCKARVCLHAGVVVSCGRLWQASIGRGGTGLQKS